MKERMAQRKQFGRAGDESSVKMDDLPIIRPATNVEQKTLPIIRPATNV